MGQEPGKLVHNFEFLLGSSENYALWRESEWQQSTRKIPPGPELAIWNLRRLLSFSGRLL